MKCDPAVPCTAVEVAGKEESKEAHLSVWSSSVGRAIHYGTASAPDLLDNEAERFFREVDHGILEHHSRLTGLPLLLAALPENQTLYRRVSHNHS